MRFKGNVSDSICALSSLTPATVTPGTGGSYEDTLAIRDFGVNPPYREALYGAAPRNPPPPPPKDTGPRFVKPLNPSQKIISPLLQPFHVVTIKKCRLIDKTIPTIFTLVNDKYVDWPWNGDEEATTRTGAVSGRASADERSPQGSRR